MLRTLLTIVLVLAAAPTTQAWGWGGGGGGYSGGGWFKNLIKGCIDKIIELHNKKLDFFKGAIEDCKEKLTSHYGSKYGAIVEHIGEYQTKIDDCLDDAADDISGAIEKLKEIKEEIIAQIMACLSGVGYGDEQQEHQWYDCIEEQNGEDSEGFCGLNLKSMYGGDYYDNMGSGCKSCFKDYGATIDIKQICEICLGYCILCCKIILWCLWLGPVAWMSEMQPVYMPEGPQGSEGLIQIVINQTTLAWALVALLGCVVAALAYKLLSKKQTYRPLKVMAESEDDLL